MVFIEMLISQLKKVKFCQVLGCRIFAILNYLKMLAFANIVQVFSGWTTVTRVTHVQKVD